MLPVHLIMAALVAAISTFFAFKSIDGYKLTGLFNSRLLRHIAAAPGQEFFRTNAQWCQTLREHYKAIRDEFVAYHSTHAAMAQGDLDSAQAAIDVGPTPWEVVYLRVFNRDTDHLARFPTTAALFAQVPGCSVAMFSVLKPGKVIPLHQGIYKGVLRYHLGLLVPKEKQKCHIMVNNRKYTWQEGRDILFDDTYPHHVINASNETRVVLFLDVRRDLHNGVLNLLNRLFLHFIRSNRNVEIIVNKINLFAKKTDNEQVAH